jgi:hypothetical protein
MTEPTVLTREQEVELARDMGRIHAEIEAAKVIGLIVAAAGGSVFVPDNLVVGDDIYAQDEPLAGGRRYFTRHPSEV